MDSVIVSSFLSHYFPIMACNLISFYNSVEKAAITTRFTHAQTSDSRSVVHDLKIQIKMSNTNFDECNIFSLLDWVATHVFKSRSTATFLQQSPSADLCLKENIICLLLR